MCDEATHAAYQHWANNRTTEDEAFSNAAHTRSIEVIKRSIADEQQEAK